MLTLTCDYTGLPLEKWEEQDNKFMNIVARHGGEFSGGATPRKCRAALGATR